MRNRLKKYLHRPAGGPGLLAWSEEQASFVLALMRLPGTPSPSEAAVWMRMLSKAQTARRVVNRFDELRSNQ